MSIATTSHIGGPIRPQWTLSDRLRKIRRDVAQVSQTDFAKQLQLKPTSYSAYEAGRAAPRDVVAFAKRVELLTHVPATWILGLDEPLPPTGEPHHMDGNITGRYLAGNRASVITFPQHSGLEPAASAVA